MKFYINALWLRFCWDGNLEEKFLILVMQTDGLRKHENIELLCSKKLQTLSNPNLFWFKGTKKSSTCEVKSYRSKSSSNKVINVKSRRNWGQNRRIIEANKQTSTKLRTKSFSHQFSGLFLTFKAITTSQTENALINQKSK